MLPNSSFFDRIKAWLDCPDLPHISAMFYRTYWNDQTFYWFFIFQSVNQILYEKFWAIWFHISQAFYLKSYFPPIYPVSRPRKFPVLHYHSVVYFAVCRPLLRKTKQKKTFTKCWVGFLRSFIREHTNELTIRNF